MTLSPLSPAALNAKSPTTLYNMLDIDVRTESDLLQRKMTSIDSLSIGPATTDATFTEEQSSSFESQVNTSVHQQDGQDDRGLSTRISACDVSSRISSIDKMSTPFEICEDSTASMMPPPPLAAPSALMRAMKRKTMSSAKNDRSSLFAMSSPTKQLMTEERMAVKASARRSLQAASSTRNVTPRLERNHHSAEDYYHAYEVISTPSEISEQVQTPQFVRRDCVVAAIEEAVIDDTCFSTFSEVPNMDMTKFARLTSHEKHTSVQTPLREYEDSSCGTLRRAASSRSPSPTPRAVDKSDNDTTTLLLDFTQQIEAFSTVSNKLRAASRRSMSPSKAHAQGFTAEPQLRSYFDSQRSPRKSTAQNLTSTPSNKNLLTLLDFELPPAPSPRSMPTISIRELESLKSNYASQISALKATLSGREAEVEALKRAVGDAERRVGETAEELREERSRRECVEREKEEWVRRGAEFEDVLKRVKKEVLEGEQEREEMLARAEDAEERAKDLETRLLQASDRAALAESLHSELKASTSSQQADAASGPLFTIEQVQKQIDEKVHILSTELHAIYKKKHVTKVAGLKKGFEAKAAEKAQELVAQIEKLERHNEDLQAKLDGTLSGPLPSLLSSDAESDDRATDIKQLEEQKVVIERQKAELAGRDEELKTQRAEFSRVMAQLEQERVEKGELVAAVDEMLALQPDMSVVHAAATDPATAPLVEEALRKSVGIGGARPTGLAKPGFGFGGPSRLAKPAVSKSRMMSQIEKMGGGRLAE